MTMVIVEPETLKELWHYQVKHNFRTHNQAIADLLERAKEDGKPTESRV